MISEENSHNTEVQVHNKAGIPTPVYVLRGHASPIHALHLFQHNLRLVSADANGWVIVWDMVSKRAVVVWKAHDGALLEVKGFSCVDGTMVIYTWVLSPPVSSSSSFPLTG